MEDFNDCTGGPRAPITHEMWDNLVAENKRLSGMIRDKYTLPPNDYGDDISTELAVQCSALEQRVKELEAERDNLKADAQKILESRAKVSLEIIDLRTENERLQAYNKDWIERCKKFRQNDYDKAQARLTEQADEFGRQIQSLHLDVAARDGEIKRLSDALKDIAEDDCGCCDAAYTARQALGGGE